MLGALVFEMPIRCLKEWDDDNVVQRTVIF